MLRGTHNGQRRRKEAWEETAAFSDSWVGESRNPSQREEGDSVGAPGLISPKLLIKPREEKGRQNERRGGGEV